MENNKNTRGRRLKDRYSKKYPDRNFDTEEGMYDLDELADQEIADLSERDRVYRENTDRMNALYRKDPRSAAMVNAWAGGVAPLEFMIENFGDDFTAALETPEGKESFKKAHEKWLDNLAEDRKFEEERAANFEKSMADLESFKDSHNLSDDQMADVFAKVYKIAENVLSGIYLPEYFEMALKAENYDADVAGAKKEGEVAGRNSKIDASLRSSESARRNLPPNLGGQGAPRQEEKPKKEKRPNMFGI